MARTLYVLIWLLTCLAGPTFAQLAQPPTDSLRVRILELERPNSITITSPVYPVDLYVDSDVNRLARLDPGTEIVVEPWYEILRVRWVHGSASVSSVRIAPMVPHLLDVRYTPANRNQTHHRPYRGLITVGLEKETLRIVNLVHLEDYIASVIPAEYPFKDIEGVKAQAVASRTYALYTLRHGHPDYDLTDHVASQKYEGAGRETDLSREAVLETAGEVMTYDDQLIEAVYSASCGGHTANNEIVWNGGAVPYLRGKRDPYERLSPHKSWTATVNRSDLLKRLSTTYQMDVDGLLLGDRDSAGRLQTMIVRSPNRRRNKTIPAAQLRSAVNSMLGHEAVKSTVFELKVRGNEYEFQGRGYGHGVGLCQWGTAAQAQDGRDYRSILSFYYSNIKFDQVDSSYDPFPPVVAVTDPVQPEPEPAVADQPEPKRPSRLKRFFRWISRGSSGKTKPQATPVAQAESDETPPPTPRRKRRPGW